MIIINDAHGEMGMGRYLVGGEVCILKINGENLLRGIFKECENCYRIF